MVLARTNASERQERKKSEKRERLLPPPDVPPRWQQSQAHRPGFDQCQRDFSRKSASPASYDDEAWKDRRRGSDEVKMALQRANFLKQEEEKRYEDEKKMDQTKLSYKNGREGRECS